MSIKTSNILYGIAIIAVIGILSGFVGYTFPTQTPTQQVEANKNTVATVTTSAKTTAATTTVSPRNTDNCGCCAERRAPLQRQRQQALKHEREKQQTANVNVQTSK